tara:strand:- start:364 stop:501 length:138 start_codon:yes stop_codon:yes gene_type:complete
MMFSILAINQFGLINPLSSKIGYDKQGKTEGKETIPKYKVHPTAF